MSTAFPSKSFNPYALGQIVGTSQNITSITNTNGVNPVTISLTAHGYATGNRVRLASVTGQTAINADWIITVVDANTFTIPLTGNGSASSGGTAVRFGLPITLNHPELAGFGYQVNAITFNAIPGNTGNIYVGNASTMLRVSPFTDTVYVIKPGAVQTMPSLSPTNANILNVDSWGIDWDTLGDGVLVSVFVR